jgi:restriction system protein
VVVRLGNHETSIVPLEGTRLAREDGKTNEIVRVDWSGIQRLTSKGNTGFIKIEIFRRVIDRLLAGETVSRAWINDEYPGRASSGIVLILSQVPVFEVVLLPAVALRLRYSHESSGSHTEGSC